MQICYNIPQINSAREGLGQKKLEMHWCIISTVAAFGLVL